MKVKKSVRISPQDLWDGASIQNWLEWEAERGWRIAKWNGWFCTFHKTEPKSCRVRVQAHGPESREAWQERIAVYEEMGWQYAATISGDLGVYYCDDPAIPELDTDPVVYAMAWKDTTRNGCLAGFALLAVALFFMIFPVIYCKSFVGFLMLADLRQLFTGLLMEPFLIVMSLRQISRARKAHKKLSAGVMPSAGNWQSNRNWWRGFVVLMLCWFLVTPAVDLIWGLNNEPDATGLPYVSHEELAPETRESDWFFEWEEYANSCRYFAPTRRAYLFSLDGEKTVRNTMDRLRFVWLAELRYQELLNEFREDCPDAQEKVITNPAFEEALLLTGEAEEQMLLVRSDTRVYSLRVNFPVELENWVDEIAAEMTEPQTA